MASSLEIEVKFYIPEVEPLREQILSLGASLVSRYFETNVCFEDEAKSFKRKDILLRLRKDDKARLTFKAPPQQRDGAFKTYRELEVEIDDFDTGMAILQSLGYHPEQRYEKWRETFAVGETHLLVDTTPFGVFLEIEGPRSDIRLLAEQLGLPWHQRILMNYLAMFDLIRQGEGLPFKDMTFENFETVDCNVAQYLGYMVAPSHHEDGL